MKKYRVHICPIGFEVDRICEPLHDPKADRVWLVTKRSNDQAAKFVKEIKSHLDDSDIEYKEASCDISNLTDALRLFGEIFKEESDNEVFVNVSSGTKIMAIAGMMACMMWDGTPYYAVPEGYNDPEKQITHGVKETIYLPRYKIDKPPESILECLRFVAKKGKNGVNKKSIIAHLKKKGLLDTQPREGRDSVTIQAEYRNLEEHVLKPARTEWKFIYEEGRGNSKRIKLTSDGEVAVSVFGLKMK